MILRVNKIILKSLAYARLFLLLILNNLILKSTLFIDLRRRYIILIEYKYVNLISEILLNI